MAKQRTIRRMIISAPILAVLFSTTIDATTLLTFPPDAEISFRLERSDLPGLATALVTFAKNEHLLMFANVPRAKDKLFFIGLRRNDETLAVFVEQRTAGGPIFVDFYKAWEKGSDLTAVKERLQSTLLGRWPTLVIAVQQSTPPPAPIPPTSPE